MKYCDTDFGQWLYQQLENKRTTAKDLAKATGISEATISRIKNGKTPLTPKMRNLIAHALSVDVTEIPADTIQQRLNASSREEHSRLEIIKPSHPDHALLNYCFQQNIFRESGIICQEHELDYYGEKHPENYHRFIEHQLNQDKTVLVACSETALEKLPMRPTRKTLSHKLSGYSLVSRAGVDFPCIYKDGHGSDLFAFKCFLEYLIDADLCPHGSRNDRIAWMSGLEYQFLDLLFGLAREAVLEEKFKPMRAISSSVRPCLSSLYCLGANGADLLVADAARTALALSAPEKYKVVLSLHDIKRIISNITCENSKTWSSLIKPLYCSDNCAAAIDYFKAFWIHEIEKLEIPIYWHLFIPDSVDEQRTRTIEARLLEARMRIERKLSSPVLRLDVVRQIYEKTQYQNDTTVLDFKVFFDVWKSSFLGL